MMAARHLVISLCISRAGGLQRAHRRLEPGDLGRRTPSAPPASRRTICSTVEHLWDHLAFSRREVVLQAVSRRADDSPAGGGRAWGAAAEITRLHSSLCTLEAAGARDAERDQEMRGSIFERYSNRECIWFVKRVFGVFLLLSISPCEILRTNAPQKPPPPGVKVE